MSFESEISEDNLLSNYDELKRFLFSLIILVLGLIGGIIMIFISYLNFKNNPTVENESLFRILMPIGVCLIIISVAIPLILIIYTSITQKLLFKSFETQQVSRDTFEATIYNDKGRFIYQIQTASVKGRLAPTITLLESVMKDIDFSQEEPRTKDKFAQDVKQLLEIPEEVKVQLSSNKDDSTSPNLIESLQEIQKKLEAMKKFGDNKEYEELKIRLADPNNPATIKFNTEALKRLNLIKNAHDCNFQIGYRNILSIKCLDDPDFSDYNHEKRIDEFGRVYIRRVYKDILLNAKGFCYILNGHEGDVFDFQESLSNDSMQVKVRKTCNKFKLIGWLIQDQIPLFYVMDMDNAQQINQLALGFEPLKDSTIHAFIELYAKESKQNDLLRNDLLITKRNNLDLKIALDKGLNDLFEEFLDQTDVERYISKKMELQPVNLTGAVLLGIGFVIGILLGLVI